MPSPDKGVVIDLITNAYLTEYKDELRVRKLDSIPGGSCVHRIAPLIATRIEDPIFTLDMAIAFAKAVGFLRAQEVMKPEWGGSTEHVRAALHAATGATSLPFRRYHAASQQRARPRSASRRSRGVLPTANTKLAPTSA
jgi:hypothetical protein